jgi:hypothetical protein
MSIKIAVLKSGEDVIADIQEMVFEEKVVGYFFNKPCVVKTRTHGDGEDKTFQISLHPWIPITKTTKVPVTVDWVITIVDPIDSLENMYKRDVLKDDQTVTTDEQPDSDI